METNSLFVQTIDCPGKGLRCNWIYETIAYDNMYSYGKGKMYQRRCPSCKHIQYKEFISNKGKVITITRLEFEDEWNDIDKEIINNELREKIDLPKGNLLLHPNYGKSFLEYIDTNRLRDFVTNQYKSPSKCPSDNK